MMNSNLLSEFGLKNYISGSDYDIRDNDDLIFNLNHFAKNLQVKPKMFYTAHQLHTSNVAYADGINGIPRDYGMLIENADGLITDKKDIALVIKFADCTPIVIFDPAKEVQAVVHSGWRGTSKRIAKVAIEKMVNDFGCNTKNMVCFIGPSIDKNNYEVGLDVYDAFESFEKRDDFFEPFKDKYKMSMVDANLNVLLDSGILRQNIDICKISTFVSPKLNSARRDNENYKLNSIITIMSI